MRFDPLSGLRAPLAPPTGQRRTRRSACTPALAAGLVMGALLLESGAGHAVDAENAAKRPDIVLITLDTTRADHLSLYGYDRETSPHLDRFSQDAAVYLNAWSTTTWTLPSHASLLTGMFPTSHGALRDIEGPLILGEAVDGPAFLSRHRARGIAADATTLTEILRSDGYSTGAVVAGPWLKRLFGLARGFDHYDDSQISTVNGRLAAQVTDAAIAWLETGPSDPVFLFLNYYDPHGPYTDPAGLARHFLPPGAAVYPPPKNPNADYVLATYDAEILYMDLHLGRLFDYLRENGRFDDAWIIVTADHGELFGEHDASGHGYSLYEAELRIPLLIKGPQRRFAPGPRSERIQLTDVLPVLLSQLGVAIPDAVQGRPNPDERADVFAEIYPMSGTPQWRALIRGNLKFLWNSEGAHELYDVVADPRERVDLVESRPEIARSLEVATTATFDALPRPHTASAVIEIDAETRKALRSLGYLPEELGAPEQESRQKSPLP